MEAKLFFAQARRLKADEVEEQAPDGNEDDGDDQNGDNHKHYNDKQLDEEEPDVKPDPKATKATKATKAKGRPKKKQNTEEGGSQVV